MNERKTVDETVRLARYHRLVFSMRSEYSLAACRQPECKGYITVLGLHPRVVARCTVCGHVYEEQSV